MAIRNSEFEEYVVTWSNGTIANVACSDGTAEAEAPSLSTSSQSDHQVSRVFIVVLFLVFLVSSAGNLIVLYIIAQHLKWRTATNVFITVLSLSDLLLALTCLPMSFVSLLKERWVFGRMGCTAHVLVSRLLGLISAGMTLLLTIDRYQTVVRLIRTKFVLRRTLFFIAIFCAASVALICPWGIVVEGKKPVEQELFRCTWDSPSPSYRAYDAVYHTVSFTGPVVCMAYCVLHLIMTIRRNSIVVCPPAVPVSQLRFIGEIQTANTVIVMVIVFAICRLPYSVVGYVGAISPTLTSVELVPSVWTMIAQLISWANGAVNPFIYAVRNPNVAKILHLDRRAGYVSEETLPSNTDHYSPGDRPGDARDGIVNKSISRSFIDKSAPVISSCACAADVRIHETSMTIPTEATSVCVRPASYDQSCVTNSGDSGHRTGSSSGSHRSMSVPSVLNYVGARFTARNSLSSVSTTLTNVMTQ